MNIQFFAICIWVVVAFVATLFPTKNSHWRRAYVLMGIAAPLLVWIIWTGGIWYGVLFALVAASVFRWPLIYLYRWLWKQIGQ